MEARVYHVGYNAYNSEQNVKDLMSNPRMLIIDTRLKPWSYRPGWCKDDQDKAGLRVPGLQSQWGRRYRFAGKVLGNLNYKGGPIKIINLDEGIRGLRYYLVRGYSLILLCQCSDVESCHRAVIMRALKASMPEVEIYSADGRPEQLIA